MKRGIILTKTQAKELRNNTELRILVERLDNLRDMVDKGFNEVTRRQDIANGKLMKHENSLTEVTTQMKNVVLKEDCAKIHYSGKADDMARNVDLDYKKITIIIAVTSVAVTGLNFALTHFGGK